MSLFVIIWVPVFAVCGFCTQSGDVLQVSVLLTYLPDYFIFYEVQGRAYANVKTGNESVPIQLAQCRFTGLAISNAKNINVFFK